MDPVEAFRTQARACAELGSPMYAALLDRLADDVERGGRPSAGVARDVLAGHEDDPGPSALGLRLLGSVHRLVLAGRAPALAPYYPSVGGSWDPDAGWAAFAGLLRDRPGEVREWLDRPPQTNEVGRAAALLGGLLRLGETHRLPVRLFEIGSSAGLNLQVDRFACTDATGARFGPADAALVLEGAWRGRSLRPWPDLRVVERLGSDVMPVDPATDEGRLLLTAYVWPDQAARLRRLRAALDAARDRPVEVRRQDAVSFVRDLDLRAGTVTVLWHSVMWQYLPDEDQVAVAARLREVGSAATEERPFAHLFLEPTRRRPGGAHEFLVVAETWLEGDWRVLGTSGGHGIPTTWE